MSWGNKVNLGKSVLFATAAGFISVSGAQAADLPVKAKPVEYVKICSLYGVGFYYIPGTDMCIKVGGYVRTQAEWGSVNGVSPGTSGPSGFATSTSTGAIGTIANGQFDRGSNNFNMTGRGVLTVDARNQSEYGTVRGYIRLGGQSISNGVTTPTFFFERAFIQFAGFTAGRTQSFFDVFITTERFNYNESKTSGDTYNYGVDLVGYTAQFGNGVSASVSADLLTIWLHPRLSTERTLRLSQAERPPKPLATICRTSSANCVSIKTGATSASAAPCIKWPGRYFGTSGVQAHPEDKYGWATQVGGQLNLPWADTVGASFVWSKGAVGYATKAGSWQILNGSSAGVGWLTDGIFDGPTPVSATNTEIHLTNAWSVNAAYEHFWNARWRTSLYGGYTKVWYDGTITNDINTHLARRCRNPSLRCPGRRRGVAASNHDRRRRDNSCSPDFSFYQIGSRTQWNITKDFYMGVDVTYTHLNTAYQGVGAYVGGVRASSISTIKTLGPVSSGRNTTSTLAMKGQAWSLDVNRGLPGRGA